MIDLSTLFNGLIIVIGIIFLVAKTFKPGYRHVEKNWPKKVPYVVDGDTLHADGEDNTVYKIRLFGIDAPEMKQYTVDQTKNAGVLSRVHLNTLINKQNVSIKVKDQDQYGRFVATVFDSNGNDLSLQMIKNGYAIADTSAPRAYKKAEKNARKTKKGLWAHSGFENPTKFRRSQ